MQFVFQGRAVPQQGLPGQASEALLLCGASHRLSTSWRFNRNIWGPQSPGSRSNDGVASGLERVLGPGVLKAPVMLFPRSSQGFLHLKFAWTRENQLVLGQHSGPFASVPELVLHYSSRPLPVQGAEHLALLYPVVTQSPCAGASAPGPAP